MTNKPVSSIPAQAQHEAATRVRSQIETSSHVDQVFIKHPQKIKATSDPIRSKPIINTKAAELFYQTTSKAMTLQTKARPRATFVDTQQKPTSIGSTMQTKSKINPDAYQAVVALDRPANAVFERSAFAKKTKTKVLDSEIPEAKSASLATTLDSKPSGNVLVNLEVSIEEAADNNLHQADAQDVEFKPSLPDFELWEHALRDDSPAVPDLELVADSDGELSDLLLLPGIETYSLGFNYEVEDAPINLINRATAEVVDFQMGLSLMGSLVEVIQAPVAADFAKPPSEVKTEQQPEQTEAELAGSIQLEDILLESLGTLNVAAIQALEPLKIQAATKIFETIVGAIWDTQVTPELIDIQVAESEQEIIQLSQDLFTCLGIVSDTESTKLFIQNVKKALATTIYKSKLLGIEELSNLGAHEHKFRHRLSTTNLIGIIRQKLQQQGRLAKYVLRVSVS